MNKPPIPTSNEHPIHLPQYESYFVALVVCKETLTALDNNGQVWEYDQWRALWTKLSMKRGIFP